MSDRSGPATSRGDRIVQRPAGQSATDRRPSSNAAASRAAFAAPRPGDRGELRRPRPGRARGTLVVTGDERPRRARSRCGRRRPSPDERDELRRREPAGPAQGEPLARALGGGQVADGSRRPAMRRGVIDRVVPIVMTTPAVQPAGARPCDDAGRRPRGPDDGSPPISPAVRTREHPEPTDEALPDDSPGGFAGALRCRRPAAPGRLLRERAAARNASRTWIPLNAAWSPIAAYSDRRRQEQPAERDAAPGAARRTRTAPAAPRRRTRRRTGSGRGRARRTGRRGRSPAGRAERAGPRGRREAPEEQLLADRRDDRGRDEVEQQARRRRPAAGSGLGDALEERPQQRG